jgi:hypothetical protein
MTPRIENHPLLIVLFWLAMLPVATVILVHVTNYITGESPQTFVRAALTTLLVAGTAFFTYDASGYGFARMMQDLSIGVQFPASYTYWDWLREPLVLKWHVLEFVPIIRFLPVLFALCAGGIVQVFLWKIPYHLGVVVFLVQVILDLLAMLLLSFVFSLGLRFYERAARPAGPPQAAESSPETTLPTAEPSDLEHLRQRIEKLGPEKGNFWRRASAGWQSANRHCQPFYDLLQPVTKHLPPPVQDFLNAGGWFLVLAGLIGLALYGPRIHRGRNHHKQHLHHKHHHAAATDGQRDDLAVVGAAMTGLGSRQLTVNGLPARLRLVVLAPMTAQTSTLPADTPVRVLDSILPGLSEVAGFDFPRQECWNDPHARDSFRKTLVEGVKVPEPEGAPSCWLLLVGEATTPQGLVHVGLAVISDQPRTDRLIDIAPGQWATVLSLRNVPKSEQNW